MRPDPTLLQPAAYPWQLELLPRFGDVDLFGHLNNVSIARCFEDARVRFQLACYGDDMLKPERRAVLRQVVAQSNISYLGEGSYPGALQCGAGIHRMGRSSYQVLSALWQHGQVVAYQACVMVVLGPDGPVALPDAVRQALGAWPMRLPSGQPDA